MRSYPSIPPVEQVAEALLDGGHLWIFELLDGGHLQFQVQSTGEILYGDRIRTFSADDAPLEYRHAVHYIEERLDRTALETAVDSVEEIIFYGVAMHHQHISYEWHRTPSFLGHDVWSSRAQAFRPPDAVVGIFDRLGLSAINTFEREQRARDMDIDRFEIPQSAWYDGQAYGVVFWNKRGIRGKVSRDIEKPNGTHHDPGTWNEETINTYVQSIDFTEIYQRRQESELPVTYGDVFEAGVDLVFRALHEGIRSRRSIIDESRIRSAVADATTAYFSEQ